MAAENVCSVCSCATDEKKKLGYKESASLEVNLGKYTHTLHFQKKKAPKWATCNEK